MGSSSSGDTTIHYDPEILLHYSILADAAGVVQDGTINLRPYSFDMSNVNNAFLDFHNNFFMFFMGGNDVQIAYRALSAEMADDPVINNEVTAHNIFLEDDIVQNVLPKIKAGLRDIGAVMTSSFPDTIAMVEMNKAKALTKYKADLYIENRKLMQERWVKTISWYKQVCDTYLEELKAYYPAADTYVKTGNDVEGKNALWPWTVLDNRRAIVGCLNGAQAGHSTTNTPSGMQQAGTYVGMAAGVAEIVAAVAVAAAA